MNMKLRIVIGVRSLLTAVILALVAACGGGGGASPPPPPPDVIVGGSVNAPNGQIAFHRAPSGPEYWLNALMPAAHAAVPGSSPVVDGTAVDLVRLDDTGVVAETLASTTTSGGRYSFNFSDLSLSIANDLLVSAKGGAGIELRAFVTSETVDVDVETEATVSLVLEQLVVNPGTVISNFTLQEYVDLVATVRLSAMLDQVSAGIDVPTTVAAVRRSAETDPRVSAFFAATAATGQTAEGPGDVGNFFPFSRGATWTFDGVTSGPGFPDDAYVNTMAVGNTRDVNGTLTTEFIEIDSTISGQVFTTLLVKTETFLSDWTGVETGGAPVDVVRFPIDPGVTLVTSDETLDLGQDLDGDGISETASVSTDSTVAGFEDKVVGAGTFSNTVRIDGTLTLDGTFSGSNTSFTGTGTVSQWFAPGIGEIAQDAEVSITSSIGSGSGMTSQQLTGGPFTVALDVSGGPSIAWGDGEYLVVACDESASPPAIYGMPVPVSGHSAGAFYIGEPHYLPQCNSSGGDKVAFDGTNYLVVYPKTDTANRTNVVAARVTPDGVVLDSPEIVLSTGISNFAPALAFDGSNYLVVWQKFDNSAAPPGEPGPGYQIYGAFVSLAGTTNGEFAIFEAPGQQGGASIAFDGSNYLVAWNDTRTGSGQTNDTDIYGTRISPAGVLLDAAPFGIVTAFGIQGDPELASNGSNWLVVWGDIGVEVPGPQDGKIYARRVAPDGSVLDGAADTLGIAVGTALVNNHSPDTTYNGTNYFVTWAASSAQIAGGESIWGASITDAGQRLGGPADVLDMRISGPPIDRSRVGRPAVASSGQDALVLWGGIQGNVIDP